MNTVEILQFVLGAGLAALGWFARVLWTAVSELKDDLYKLKESLPTYYVRKDDFKDFKDTVIAALWRIENLIAGKQDK